MPPLDPRHAWPAQWRSLLQADPGFAEQAAREFPGLADALAHPSDRRAVFRLMAAGFALAGLGGCDDPGAPARHLVPAVITPPDIVAGLPNRYATVDVTGGAAAGVVVTQRDGRPIKVEGNPLHPASLGATSIHAQAMVLDLYDPDRSAGIARAGVPSDLPALRLALAAQRATYVANGGAGLRILTGAVASPHLAARIAAVRAAYPQARWHQWDLLSRETVRQGAISAYGRDLTVLPRPAAADVILAIESDLISAAPGHLAHAAGVAARRNPTRTDRMSRVYAIEPTPTLIGMAADHRFIAAPGELDALVAGIAAGVLSGEMPSGLPPWVAPLVTDLAAARGRALIHAGPEQSVQVHALVHAMNDALGGQGHTYQLIAPPLPTGEDLATLVADMQAGRVTALVILDTDPVFTAPPDFAAALPRVPFSIGMAEIGNATTAATGWFVPQAHPFELWGDALGHDGTRSIIQPQALPLYGGTDPAWLLGLLVAPDPPASRDALRTDWAARHTGNTEASWRACLAAGVETASAPPPVAAAATRPAAAPSRPEAAPPALRLLFRADPNLLDGRHANNAWLQELPRPLTKLTWDNPLHIAPATAAAHGLANGDIVRITADHAAVEAPVWIVPGQSPGCIVALTGYGSRHGGAVAEGTGFDFLPLRAGPADVTLQRTGRTHRLAATDHHTILDVAADAPAIVRHTTLADFLAHPQQFRDPPRPSLLPPPAPSPTGVAWGMAIDLNACIGCNACVVACQAENNIPVVGKAEVLRAREMHWLRIDRYWEGTPDAPDTLLQPMLCMHCEQAPCEVVCPVGATMTDQEGLNVMVYNRCVGTRFCSNNCPYKVRRFNYFDYPREEARPEISRNPDVTVRARGVMEKCTYCIQRVAAARVEADRTDTRIADGTVVTACQAACPTQAFTFGNIADPGSAVSRRKASPLDYALLADQNTRPRTTYEARVCNLNPAIA